MREGGGKKQSNLNGISSLQNFSLCYDQYIMTVRKCKAGAQTQRLDKTKVLLIKTALQINQTLCTYLLGDINQQWIDYSE